MSSYDFDSYVVTALFPEEGAAFGLGDGTVRFQAGETIEAHQGTILCGALHPSGSGILTGGDDGRLVWSKPSGASTLAELGRKWIDAVATNSATGMIAFAAGREVHVRDVADGGFSRCFRHERTVADLAFDKKGRRIAAATYGGAALWYARIAEQTPQMLRWAGSHIRVLWSPDGKFLMSSMQEGALHGWRIADRKDLRMGGYPTKVKSMTFLAEGMMLATSGAPAAVVWPFLGANGPMGREAAEIGRDETAMIARVAAAPQGRRLAAGLADGRVWTAELGGRGLQSIASATGAAISALAVSIDGERLAWGDEAGHAGFASI